MKRAKKRSTGFACDGERFVYVTYGPEEFFRLWGGTPDDYRDFLAARQEEMARERDDLCLFWPVRVPFDPEDFAAWAAEDPRRASSASAHGEWALWVARQPERLAALRARHRYDYCVPRDEVLKVETLVWCLAVGVPDPAAARRLGAPLPPGLLRDLVGEFFRGVWRGAPTFERLSARRARGLAAVPGDHLVLPGRAGCLVPAAERLAARPGGGVPEHFAVAARHRIRPPSRFSYPRTEVVGFPLVLLGSTEDVDTAMARLYATDADELPLAAWEDFFAGIGVPFYAAHSGRFTIASLAGGLAEEIRREIAAEAGDRPRRQRHLRRVK